GWTLGAIRTHEVGPLLVPSITGGPLVTYVSAGYNSYGTATISASTTVTVTHNLIAAPTAVLATPQTTGYGTFLVGSITATTFVITVTVSGTYRVDRQARQ